MVTRLECVGTAPRLECGGATQRCTRRIRPMSAYCRAVALAASGHTFSTFQREDLLPLDLDEGTAHRLHRSQARGLTAAPTFADAVGRGVAQLIERARLGMRTLTATPTATLTGLHRVDHCTTDH